MARMPVEARRRALIAAALRVVAARGLGAASTRAIVAEAGMSLASFHYAFESRDELIELLIPEVLAHEQKAMLGSELAGDCLEELIAEGLTGYLTHLRADPQHEQALMDLTQYALRSRVSLAEEQYAQYQGVALAALDQAATLANQRWTVPLATVATLLVALTDGMTLNWLVTRNDDVASEVVAAAAKAVASLAEPIPEETP